MATRMGIRFRSIVLGLAGATFLGVVTFYNDLVLRGTNLVGNYLPVSVFGALLLLTLAVNPLLARIHRRAALTASEIAVAFAIVLFACYVPGLGLMHYFTAVQMMPHHHLRTTPGWQGDPARLDHNAVRDWPAFVDALARAESRPEGDLLRALSGRLPPDLLAPSDPADHATRDLLLEALHTAMADPALPVVAPRPDAATPRHVRHLLAQDDRTPEQALALHRGLLEAALPGVIARREASVIERTPPRMLADPRADPARALDGFVTGIGSDDEPFHLREIPWHAWRGSLLFWVPLLLTLILWVVAFALVAHRQWVSHEHLPYPTAEFARAMLPEKGQAMGAVFRERLFWVSFLVVLLIHMVNYAQRWWPQELIPIQRRIDLMPLRELFPMLGSRSAGQLLHPTIYFTIIGFAYLLSSDISLSMGIAPYLFSIAVGTAAAWGISFGGGLLQPSIETSLYTGGYMAMFLVIIYTGRQWFRGTFARALGLPSRERVTPYAVWGARVFLIAFTGFVAQLAMLGIPWPMALVYSLGALMVYVVVSHLLAEAGVIFVYSPAFPCVMIWTFMGATAAGVDHLLILAVVTSVIIMDVREALMPFVVTGLRVADRPDVALGRVARWGFVGVSIALLAGIPAVLFWQYRLGAVRTGHAWALEHVARLPYNVNSMAVRNLDAQGALDLSRSLEGFSRIANISIQPSLLIAFLVTFVLVFLFTFLRHRFARFPFHPLIFVVMGTYQSACFAFSFLLGWFIKSTVAKYGGARIYQKLKPLMMGLVGGEVFAGLLMILIGAVYHRITETPPIAHKIFP